MRQNYHCHFVSDNNFKSSGQISGALATFALAKKHDQTFSLPQKTTARFPNNIDPISPKGSSLMTGPAR